MPEQQKVDETIESTSVLKKKPTKVEQSSTALEKDLDATETEVDDQGNATETEVDYLKGN